MVRTDPRGPIPTPVANDSQTKRKNDAPLRFASGDTGWTAAVRIIARWLDTRERVDALMEALPASIAGAERGRCQNLVYGCVRHFGRIEPVYEGLIAHPPRFSTRAVLTIAAFELIEAQSGTPEDGIEARIVHHAVERTKTVSSAAEARLVNAVVRKAAQALRAQKAPAGLAQAPELALYYSHPEWLVRRWFAQFGAEATRKLLVWNQSPAPVYARWRRDDAPPDWLAPTRWRGFHEVPPGRWPEVEALITSGALYLQDPSTRLSVELLDPRPGETVLDLCAAPGGKSLQAADRMGTGRVVAVDLPTARIDRLTQNFTRLGKVEGSIVIGDLGAGLYGVLKEHRLPTAYPAVLVDVPCSNTGVMRHRIDVKWRLQEGDFAKHSRNQLHLLESASRLVGPKGRIVYSTCSIDPIENEKVVEAFLAKHKAYTLSGSAVAFPWIEGHDGAAAFLLTRT
jgi:16S rRNA (cytosine967-C5)-methyltransferase